MSIQAPRTTGARGKENKVDRHTFFIGGGNCTCELNNCYENYIVLLFISIDPLGLPIAILVSVFALVNLNLWGPHKSKFAFTASNIPFIATTFKFIIGLSIRAAEDNTSWAEMMGWCMISMDLFSFLSAFFIIIMLMVFH